MMISDGNGGTYKLEREKSDYLKLAIGLITILGAFATVMLYLFPTYRDLDEQRRIAIMEHAEIEKTAALATQKAELLQQNDHAAIEELKKAISDVKVLTKIVYDNQRTILRDEGLPTRRIPASVSFDDIQNP